MRPADRTAAAPVGAMGVDIGGTKMAVAAVDATGRILARAALPTEAGQGFGRAVARLSEAIRQVAAEAGWLITELRTPEGRQPAPLTPARSPLKGDWEEEARAGGSVQQSGPRPRPGQVRLGGIGIGCAGPVNPRRGTIHNPYTLPGWAHCDIVTPLRERFGVPVFLENDADAALLGECFVGAGRGFDPVVMLTFGTGIGGAAVVGGRIYRGVQGEHPELGHVPVAPEGPACYCGSRGCLESLASGTAIAAAGQALGLADAPAVFAAARQGHAPARAIIERAVAAGACAAWTIFHTLLPQRLILGGGMMDEHFEGFAEAMRRRLAGATQFSREAVAIVRAALGNDAGLVGAASLVWAAGPPPAAAPTVPREH